MDKKRSWSMDSKGSRGLEPPKVMMGLMVGRGEVFQKGEAKYEQSAERWRTPLTLKPLSP